MPFMKGREPVRRTLKYLEAGKLVLKDKIKIIIMENITKEREVYKCAIGNIQFINNHSVYSFRFLDTSPASIQKS